MTADQFEMEPVVGLKENPNKPAPLLTDTSEGLHVPPVGFARGFAGRVLWAFVHSG